MVKKSKFIKSLFKYSFVTAYLIFSANIFAAEDIFIVEEQENKLTPIKLRNGEKAPKVKVDFSENNFKDGSNDKGLSWQPRWITSGVASLGLIGSSIIDDNIVFIEKAGKKNGPQGALLVTYDYKENEFQSIGKLSNYEIKKYKIDLESNLLFATFTPQRCFQQKKDGVIAAELDTGKVLTKSLLEDEKDQVKGVNISGNNVLVSYYSEYDEKINIEVFDFSLKKKGNIKTPFNEGLLVPINDSEFAFLSKSGGIIIDNKSLKIKKDKKLNFSLITKISQAEYCSNLDKFIVLTQQGLLLSIDNSKNAAKKTISNSVSSQFQYNNENGLLSFYNGSKKRIFVLKTKENFKSLALISIKRSVSKGESVKWCRIINDNPVVVIGFTSYGRLFKVNFNTKRKRGKLTSIIQPVQ